MMTSPSDGDQGAQDPFQLARRLQVPIWVFDIDRSRIAFANAAACALWQARDEAELCARDMSQGMSSTVAKRLKQYQADFHDRDAVFNEMWTLYPNGQPTNVMVLYRGFFLSDGRMAMQCEVVGEAESDPDNIRSAEALLHTDVVIALYSRDGPPLYMNPAARNVLGSTVEPLDQCFVNQDDYHAMMEEVASRGECRLVTHCLTTSGRRWFDITAKNCTDAATGDPATLVTAVDISELKVARDTARYLADRDQLTGCFNRSYLQAHFQELADGGLSGECAVVFFDVDRFKQINDRLGHDMGDAVLVQVARRIHENIRAEDIVARLGGDEFVILLHDTHGEDEIRCKIETLRAAISEPIYHEGTVVTTSVSMGVVVQPVDQMDFTDAMRKSDIALYVSKQRGRDCATFFDPEMGEAARERDELEANLRDGLVREEFELFYQPRFEVRSGRMVSVEGLVRWNHPRRGVVMPNVFIPICEETGMIEALGQQIVKMGCEQAIAWHRDGQDVEVSINISPRQFNDGHLLALLAEMSRRPDFPNRKIELEITENVLIGDHETIADKLRTITRMGYRIAIDDFGTGYSNLSYISRFPLTCIKIDRSFINQLPESGPIVDLILTLARQIGATTVAEGVETEAQYDWLRQHGCDQIQGFYLARPEPISAFEARFEPDAPGAPQSPRRAPSGKDT